MNIPAVVLIDAVKIGSFHLVFTFCLDYVAINRLKALFARYLRFPLSLTVFNFCLKKYGSDFILKKRRTRQDRRLMENLAQIEQLYWCCRRTGTN